MLQRNTKQKPTRKQTPAMKALQLLQMRDDLRAKFGEVVYLQKTTPYRQLAETAIRKFGCPVRAAAMIASSIKSPADIETKKIITCAALDLHFEAEQLPLAS